jgi:hypothetical protein
MNLAETINVLPLLEAGGVGSGPNAPCPSCGPHKIEQGDTVKTKVPVKMFNNKTLEFKTFPPGTKAAVLNVLPKIGTGDQMVSVITKGHDPEHMKLDDVELHKKMHPDELGKLPVWTHKWSRNPQAPANKAQDIKPVPKSQTILKFKTSDGANVTWVKPHDEAHDTKTLKDIAGESHYLKGKFELTNSVQGLQDRPGLDRVTKQYDTSGMPAHLQQGSNASIEVNTYYKGNSIKNVVINERNTTGYSQKIRGVLSFDYKNTAAAVGMLKSRYGITQTMTRLSKAKFGV